MRRLLTRLRNIILLSDTMPVELALGALAVIWGLWMILRGDQVDVIPLFRALFTYFHPHTWGVGCILLGTGHWGALAGEWTRGRQYLTLAAVGFWAAVSAGIAYAETEPRTPILFTTAFYAFLAGWCYLRLRVEAV